MHELSFVRLKVKSYEHKHLIKPSKGCFELSYIVTNMKVIDDKNEIINKAEAQNSIGNGQKKGLEQEAQV